ncbi:hypothetical protein R1flu_020732 [Riccia fluitans]|uniref:Uncharacterized protein n=1 Tax=Riccia fluitans TaxID=41844 RepID=A0ABD1ZMC8_9MARC
MSGVITHEQDAEPRNFLTNLTRSDRRRIPSVLWTEGKIGVRSSYSGMRKGYPITPTRLRLTYENIWLTAAGFWHLLGTFVEHLEVTRNDSVAGVESEASGQNRITQGSHERRRSETSNLRTKK